MKSWESLKKGKRGTFLARLAENIRLARANENEQIRGTFYERSCHMENRISGLKKHTDSKKADAFARAVNTIKKLMRAGSSVNFNSVSMESGLSKTYLYNNPEIRTEIERIRIMQSSVPKNERARVITTDKGKDVLILALRKKVQELTEENKKNKTENKILRGKLYDGL